ncbi:hypothetical protein [Burkholderia cenocepacia]|uniref:hypothetical protein n=1 Tax=Burkholderia cenocepacia TaxID=95486 RepID=UPI000A523964|nr:hypothetical protein [Burkholderia cenocepacia]
MNTAVKLIRAISTQKGKQVSPAPEPEAGATSEPVFLPRALEVDVIAASWHLRELSRADEVKACLADGDVASRIVVVGAGPIPGGKLVEHLVKLSAPVSVRDAEPLVLAEYPPKNEPWYRRHAFGRNGRQY